MAVRDEVRNTQRTIANLDAAHRRALGRLEQAVTRRSAAIAEQDRLVAAAQAGVDSTVTDMAKGLGVELAAHLLGLDITEVRRLAKAQEVAPVNVNVNAKLEAR